MDQDRQIRFVIPPFFLLASLFLGAYLGGVNLQPFLNLDSAESILGLLAATAVIVMPLGFLIGTISILFLRFMGWVATVMCSCRVGFYEVRLSKDAFESIWKQVSADEQQDPKKVLYVAATFDHELLKPGIHAWIMRRWNAFNTAAHSSVALVLAFVSAYFFDIPWSRAWTIVTIALVSLLVVAAFFSWRDTMGMLEFQALNRKPQAANDGGVE